jgi:hypothetical protein
MSCWAAPWDAGEVDWRGTRRGEREGQEAASGERLGESRHPQLHGAQGLTHPAASILILTAVSIARQTFKQHGLCRCDGRCDGEPPLTVSRPRTAA